jgi:hypothetical protein
MELTLQGHSRHALLDQRHPLPRRATAQGSRQK